MITEDSKLIRLLIKDESIEKKVHLFTISHRFDSNRGPCLKRFCRRKGFKKFDDRIFEGGFSRRDIYNFLGTSPKEKDLEKETEDINKRLRIILKFSFLQTCPRSVLAVNSPEATTAAIPPPGDVQWPVR